MRDAINRYITKKKKKGKMVIRLYIFQASKFLILIIFPMKCHCLS